MANFLCEYFFGDYDEFRTMVPERSLPITPDIEPARTLFATECRFENDELVYGDEMGVKTFTECFELAAPPHFCLPTFACHARVVQTEDKSLRGQTLLFSEYPFNAGFRGKAEFKPAQKSARNTEFWRRFGEVHEQGCSLQEIADQFGHDLIITSGNILTARFFEPDRDRRRTRASRGHLEKAIKLNYERTNIDHADSAQAAILWGIVPDYEETLQWLLCHEEVRLWVELAEEGTLFTRLFRGHVGGAPVRIHRDAAAKAADEMDAAIHNALSGTDELDGKKSLIEAGNRSVLAHLRKVFGTRMLNLHKACEHGAPTVSGGERLADVQAEDASPANYDERAPDDRCAAMVQEMNGSLAFIQQPLVVGLASGDFDEFRESVAAAIALAGRGVTDDRAVSILRKRQSRGERRVKELARWALVQILRADI